MEDKPLILANGDKTLILTNESKNEILTFSYILAARTNTYENEYKKHNFTMSYDGRDYILDKKIINILSSIV